MLFEANDSAFQSAVVDLFDTLESWDKSHRLADFLVLQGREAGQEPYTTEDDEAGLYTWDLQTGAHGLFLCIARDSTIMVRRCYTMSCVLTDYHFSTLRSHHGITRYGLEQLCRLLSVVQHSQNFG
jgi:hypothetical protein